MIKDTSAQDRQIAAPRRSPLKLAAIGAGGLLALALFGLSLSSWLAADTAVSAERLRIAEVQRGTLVRDTAVNGRVVAAVSPTLYAAVASTVALRIEAGETVQAGQVLAELDSPELMNQLERERATLAELEVEVSRQRLQAQRARLLARRNADEAAMTQRTAQRELERAEEGFRRGALAEVELLRARDALASAKVRAEHAAADVELEIGTIGFELQTREKQLERQRLQVVDTERRVEELKVRAPVEGIVGTVLVADRAVVAPNTPLLTVVDLSRLEVELEMPENVAEDLGLGMLAEVRVGNANVAARVSAISPEVVNRQVLARVRFEGGQPPGLRQNQRVTARVLFEERPDTLVLARGPFLETHGGRFAYVINGDGIAERRAFTLGATSVASVEILAGLKPGDRVVIAGSDAFGEAERVRVN
jgi:HlyD family secretion protein